MDKDVLSLFKILEQKNSYLLEFHKLNQEELKKLCKGHLNNLETFYYSREIILNAIERLDKKLHHHQETSITLHSEEKRKLEEMLKLKKDMVLSILDQDFTILSLFDKFNETEIKKVA